MNQGTTRIASNYQKLKKARKILPQNLQRKHGPADTFISDILAPELGKNKFLLF